MMTYDDTLDTLGKLAMIAVIESTIIGVYVGVKLGKKFAIREQKKAEREETKRRFWDR